MVDRDLDAGRFSHSSRLKHFCADGKLLMEQNSRKYGWSGKKMDVFEYAIQMERDGEKLYRYLANRSTEAGFINIFTMLAEDEIKHCHIFMKMKTEAPSMPKTEILTKAKNIFAQIIDANQSLHFNRSQLELYQQAREIEKKSQDFYRGNAAETNDSKQRELWLQITAEEEQHYFLLYNIIELVLRPQTWVKNEEFAHFDEY